ncbi:MAG: hypothetical protein U1F43_17925 [Myxococcota bacterium]
MLGPAHEGLLLDDIFRKKILADDFLALHTVRPRPTQASATGHDSFYVLSPVPG